MARWMDKFVVSQIHALSLIKYIYIEVVMIYIGVINIHCTDLHTKITCIAEQII